MLDHVGLNVKDYAASRAFYEQALAPLGWSVAMASDEWKAVGLRHRGQAGLLDLGARAARHGDARRVRRG